MYYTIISKKAPGQHWQVRKTVQDRREAERYAEIIRFFNASVGGYRVATKAHYKDLAKLLNVNGLVVFNDGTQATLKLE